MKEICSTMFQSGIAIYELSSGCEDFIIKDFFFREAGQVTADYNKLEKITGMPFQDVFPELKESVLFDVLHKVQADGKQRTVFIELPYGSNFKVYRNLVFQLASGKLTVVFEDLTEHKEAETKLYESELRYRGLVENLPILICRYKGSNGIVTYVNDEYCRYFNIAQEEIVGKSFFDLIPDSEWKALKGKLESLTPECPLSEYEHKVSAPDGLRWQRWIDQAIFDEQGILQEYQSIGWDVTDEKTYQSKIVAALEKARESDRLKTVFLQNISHEIRTPLNGIMGFSELLQQSDISREKRIEYSSIIRQSGQHLLDIVNNLLNIAAIEAGSVKLRNTEVCINSMFNELMVHFAPQADQQNLNITVNCDFPEDKSRIITDADKLREIFKNLISNAFKFTNEGDVEIGCEHIDEHLHFYIKDTGIGIESHLHDTIFEPFRQVDETTHRIYGGSGLGLSICRAYIKLLGGDLKLNSAPGEGTHISFALPAQSGQIEGA
jgi:PAS domain S-box-containing protein